MTSEIAHNLKRTIHDICASDFLDPDEFDPHGLSPTKLEQYMSNSHHRLQVIKSKFEELGYIIEEDKFDYGGFDAINAIFKRDGNSDGEIWITAHHDYCAGLGAEDNASGLSIMLEIARYFKDSEIGKKLVFASFDLEEPGLQGSEHYAKNLPKNKLDKIKYMINLECLGSGKDVVVCKSVSAARSDPALVESLLGAASSSGYQFIAEDFDFFIADHLSFVKRGVKSAEVCSLNHGAYKNYGGTVSHDRQDGSIAHTINDVPENIDAENMSKVCKTIIKFVEDYSSQSR